MSVEEDRDEEAREGKSVAYSDLQVADVPGLEEAVAANMRQLFPPKSKQERPELRRANSI